MMTEAAAGPGLGIKGSLVALDEKMERKWGAHVPYASYIDVANGKILVGGSALLEIMGEMSPFFGLIDLPDYE